MVRTCLRVKLSKVALKSVSHSWSLCWKSLSLTHDSFTLKWSRTRTQIEDPIVLLEQLRFFDNSDGYTPENVREMEVRKSRSTHVFCASTMCELRYSPRNNSSPRDCGTKEYRFNGLGKPLV